MKGTIQYPPAAHDMQTEGDPAEWFRRNCVLVEKSRWDAVSHANKSQAEELASLRLELYEASRRAAELRDDNAYLRDRQAKLETILREAKGAIAWSPAIMALVYRIDAILAATLTVSLTQPAPGST